MKNKRIAIIGLGYVGLPLAVEFGKKRNTIGFDINSSRIDELKKEKISLLKFLMKNLKMQINLVIHLILMILKIVKFSLSPYLHQLISIRDQIYLH